MRNYGGARAGNVSLTEATVWSYNTAYARLMMDLGPAKAVDMAGRLGVRTPLQAVPAAVLGTENVTVLDMADAYATFANRGVHVTPSLVTSDHPGRRQRPLPGGATRRPPCSTPASPTRSPGCCAR